MAELYFHLSILILVYNFEKHFKFDLELQSEMLGSTNSVISSWRYLIQMSAKVCLDNCLNGINILQNDKSSSRVRNAEQKHVFIETPLFNSYV